MHPRHDDLSPQNSWPGNQWIYQNTYVDMEVFSEAVDKMMALAGIDKQV